MGGTPNWEPPFFLLFRAFFDVFFPKLHFFLLFRAFFDDFFFPKLRFFFALPCFFGRFFFLSSIFCSSVLFSPIFF